MRKKRRVALVTGGTGGIGYAVSRALIEQGYNLVLHHRSSTKNIQNLKAFAKKKAAIIHLIQADFTDPVQLEVCVCKATEYAQAMGGIDAAIFCAGVNEKKQYRDITTLDYDNIFSVNSKAPLLITQRLLAGRCFKRGASLLTIGTPNGFIGGSLRNMLYAMSKTSLLGFTKNLARALAPGIRVNYIVPGFIQTRMLTEHTDAKELMRKKASIPAGRFGTPDEIARTVVFLVSDDASYITGQTLHVNGGLFLS